MFKGKKTCKILKDIRREIARANDIDLVISECAHKGDCAGTCPRCEDEVRYLEEELARRRSMGKKVAVAGVMTASLMTVMQSCGIREAFQPVGDVRVVERQEAQKKAITVDSTEVKSTNCNTK